MALTIVLIDPFKGGHHAIYAERICIALLESGVRVGLVVGDAEAVAARVRARCDAGPEGFVAHEYVPLTPWPRLPFRFRAPMEALGRWWQARLWVGRVRRELGAARVQGLFAWLDSYLDPRLPAGLVDLLFPFDWTGIWFHPRAFRGDTRGRRATRRAARVLRARRCRAVGLLDDGVLAAVAAEAPSARVVHVPDAADATPPDPDFWLAKEVRAGKGKRTAVGLIGSLERRKGVMTFLEVARRMPADRWQFVLAGQLAASTFSESERRTLREVAAGADSGVVTCFEAIPGEAQFNAVIDACDILFAVYEGFPHSSNVLAKAALFRKPVIVAEGHYMAEQVRRYRIGEVVPEGDAGACARALVSVGEALHEGGRYGFAASAEAHSIPRFAASLGRLVEA